ncbi:MAG: hypothetical protein DMF79_09080 [Acidobacteria bacterium]|nr:MAG: hypothetical protein DMF79_09080 [Acidobacteriota bacterium]
MHPFRPMTSKVSRASPAAWETVTVATGPLANRITATAVSSTSRAKAVFARMPCASATGPKMLSSTSRR